MLGTLDTMKYRANIESSQTNWTTGQAAGQNSIDKILRTATAAQSGALDAPATMVSLMDSLRRSQDPEVKKIADQIELLSHRMDGNYDRDKIPVLLKNMIEFLKIAGAQAPWDDSYQTGNQLFGAY